MPRLLVLNGPPGVGKSTLARRYLDDHPGALNLDVDRLRRFVGQWRADPVASAALVRAFGAGAARVHLGAAHDVVVPHYLGRVEHLQELEALAAEAGVEYREFVLLESKDRILARFAARTATAEDPLLTNPAHADPAHADPAHADPGHADPVHIDAVHIDPVHVDPVHVDAQQLLDAAGGTPQLEAMYDRLLLLIANRPHAELLAAPEGDVEATYAGLLARLAG